jgi:hypothetical protein
MLARLPALPVLAHGRERNVIVRFYFEIAVGDTPRQQIELASVIDEAIGGGSEFLVFLLYS